MSRVKNRLLSFMRRMMINCEEASLISSREMLEKVSMREKMDLHMHLAGCKHCRKYHRQSVIIHHSLRQIKNTDRTELLNGHRLSTTEKSAIKRLIQNKIQAS